MANVDVGEATVRDHGVQFVGNTRIDAFYHGVSEDDKAQREWKDVISWLSPSHEAIELQDILEAESRSNRRLETAGSWFVESKSFKDWIEGRSKLTWVNGAMGCGKTVLFLRAIDEVRDICRSHENTRLAYYYCASRDPLGQDLGTLFKSLLRQLCSRKTIPTAIRRLYEKCERGIDYRAPTTQELVKCLRKVISESSRNHVNTSSAPSFYLLLDGLDELEGSLNEFMVQLKSIVSPGTPNAHILLVSRSHTEIESSLKHTATWVKLPVDTNCVQNDIEQFVSSEMDSTPLCGLDENIKEEIVDRVGKQSCGMFLWAFLQLQSLKALKRPITAPKVRQKLQSLPETLDKTYDEMLQSLDDCDKPLAQRALRWLVFSVRPLYLEELIDALAIDLGAKQIIVDRLNPPMVEELLKDFVQVHPALSLNEEEFQNQRHRVVLAHASIKEYLFKNREVSSESNSEKHSFRLESAESNIILAQSCLAYLLCFNTYELRHHCNEFPLLRYAWYHWEEYFNTSDLQYERTFSTVKLRRVARILFTRIQEYLEDMLCSHEDQLNRIWPFDSQLMAILQGLERAINEYGLDLQTLPNALNIPYFHPGYDEFCPSGSMKTHFEYTPLDDPTTWIRLVETLPAVDSATPVSCRLVTCKLSDSPSYASLSYIWGTPEAEKSISLEGRIFRLLPSQFMMLQSMRSSVEDETWAVWLDYICIDQRDQHEAASQIQLLPIIYRNAQEVVLFVEADTSEQAVHHLAKLAAVSVSLRDSDFSTDACNKARNTIFAMEASGELRELPYVFGSTFWTRSWTLQEIVCATKLVVLLHNAAFSFDIIEQIMAARDFITNILQESATNTLAALQRTRGWWMIRKVVHTRTEYQQRKRIELPALIWRFRHADTTLPRDKIYSLLAMCASDSDDHIVVDYSRSLHEVAIDTSHWFLRTYQSLDFLGARSAYGVVRGESNMCSWVLPFWDLTSQRVPFDLGVFGSAEQMHIYAATGANSCTVLVPTNSREVLGIRGLAFDEIGVQPEPYCHQSDCATSSSGTWFKAVSYAQAGISGHKSPQKTMEARWRTVTANQWPPGEALGTAMLRGTRIPPETEDEEQALLQMIDNEFNLPLLHGRRVITSRGGRLGLVPEEFEKGDLVVLLTGGSTPYILRRLETGQYRFIGSCYIHGCMNGEVIEPLGQTWYTETFEII